MFMKKFSKVPTTITATLSLLSVLAVPLHISARENYKVKAEFVGAPNLSNPPSDQFGATVSIPSNKLFIVGAPGATPDELVNAGAAYVFERDGKTWSSSQIYINPNAGNLVADVLVAARGQWLFVPANGTPLDETNPELKDYSGALLVFQLDQNNQYQLIQTLFNPDGIMPGGLFGFNVSYNGGEWMAAGGAGVSKAYFFKLDHSTNLWEFKQSVSVTGTDTTAIGYVFPCVFGTHALVSQVIPAIPNLQSNGAVFAYEFDGEQWNYIQTLAGVHTEISPTYSCYDIYGEFIAGDGHDAVISAPQDTDTVATPSAEVAGAAYFYHFHDGQWELNAKVRSTVPSTMFGFGLAIDGNTAVIGDCGRKVNDNIYQGALQVYKKQGGSWTPSALLVDPNGRAFDFFGGGGVDINFNHIGGGTDPFTTTYFPENYPGKNDSPNNNGRAVLYK